MLENVETLKCSFNLIHSGLNHWTRDKNDEFLDESLKCDEDRNCGRKSELFNAVPCTCTMLSLYCTRRRNVVPAWTGSRGTCLLILNHSIIAVMQYHNCSASGLAPQTQEIVRYALSQVPRP